jgi:hypothetical protein
MAILMKELSDIKASLAVNTNETQNIKSSITEIKIDIKEIKNDFVNRREFAEAIKDIREEISPLKKMIYAVISVVVMTVLGAILSQVIIS